MDSGIGARGICVSSQSNEEGDGVQQQNQKCIVVAGEFCVSTEEWIQHTANIQWSPGLLVDSVNKAFVVRFQSRATVKEWLNRWF